MTIPQIKIIGAGLAGCEAAWQLANKGLFVELYEMRPRKKTAAHKTEKFCELVYQPLNGLPLLLPYYY